MPTRWTDFQPIWCQRQAVHSRAWSRGDARGPEEVTFYEFVGTCSSPAGPSERSSILHRTQGPSARVDRFTRQQAVKSRKAAKKKSTKTRRAQGASAAHLSTPDIHVEGEPMKPAEVMSLIKEHSVQAVDVRFVDLPGLWQHFTVSAKEFSEDAFEEGLGFDGSSIRGFQEIQESDMLLDAGSGHRVPRSLHGRAHAGADLRRQGSGDRRVVHARSAAHREEGRGVPEVHRDRRHGVLRPGGGILHLRRRPLRSGPRTTATTTSTRSRDSGTPGARRNPTSATSLATRKATSRCRRWTSSRTSAPR